MFLTRLKNVTAINKRISCRSIEFTASSRTSKIIPVNTKTDTNQKDVGVYRPLTEDEIQKIINLDNINIVTKFQTKLPQRPPLVKNFFIGKVDNELLAYPQVIQLKDLIEMREKLQPISDYFITNAKQSIDLRFRDVSNQMVADFQRMKLFGSSVHQRFAGTGYFKSELNFASECEANDIKSFLMLAGHRLAVEAISDHGDISQHNEYLMAMAKGEVIGAVCLHDPLNLADTKRISVTKSHDGDYILNGSKNFVICSQHANLLIVLAEKSLEIKEELDEDDDEDEIFDRYLACVVDPNTSGITMTDERQTIGCNDVPFVTVNFNDVRISKSQILTETLDDRKISDKLVASSRLQSATLNMVQARQILTHLLHFCINTECYSEKLRDLMYVQDYLAKMATHLYGLESMIYLTAGIIDQYDNPKIDLECAITKAYSQDLLRRLNEFAMNLLNTPTTITSHPVGIDIRDTIQLQSNESSAILKNYVGKIGMQFATDNFGHRGNNYKDSFMARIGISNKTIESIPKKLYLSDNLHPSLMDLADDLERSIVRLRCACEMLLSRYGESVDERQVEIQNIGEAAMQNYAMFASLARASRSYCIGLQHSAYETICAAGVCGASTDILEMVLDIKYNRSGYDGVHKTIAENAIKQFKQHSKPPRTSGVIPKVDK